MTDKKEATLVSYKLLYDRYGKLITERSSTDISGLKKFLSKEEFTTLEVVLREATAKLDSIHSYIETHLNARIMKD